MFMRTASIDEEQHVLNVNILILEKCIHRLYIILPPGSGTSIFILFNITVHIQK